MQIIFDARPMAMEYTGLGRYTSSLLLALLESYSNSHTRIHVLLQTGSDRTESPCYESVALHARKGRCHVHFLGAPALSLRQHWAVRRWVNCRGADVYFYPHFDLPLGINIDTTFVIHDVIPLAVDGYVLRFSAAKRAYFRNMIRHGVRTATRCVAVSETTRRDILSLVGSKYSEKIVVSYEGSVLRHFGRSCTSLSELGVETPFLLYVGDRRPHKNIRRILDVFFQLRAVHAYPGTLVMAGSRQSFDFDVERYIAGRTDVRVLGNVTDEQLVSLYSSTDALVFLSEYEGFGLPVVEAAKFHRKMILSDGGALAEIAPPAACMLPRTLQIDLAADRAAAYLRDAPAPNYSAFNARFSWEAAARTVFPGAFV